MKFSSFMYNTNCLLNIVFAIILLGKCFYVITLEAVSIFYESFELINR